MYIYIYSSFKGEVVFLNSMVCQVVYRENCFELGSGTLFAGPIQQRDTHRETPQRSYAKVPGESVS